MADSFENMDEIISERKEWNRKNVYQKLLAIKKKTKPKREAVLLTWKKPWGWGSGVMPRLGKNSRTVMIAVEGHEVNFLPCYCFPAILPYV